jgi:hypothetical protein
VDNAQWWPDGVYKQPRDATADMAIYPVKLLLSMWWGDWIDNAPAGPGPEDQIRPLPLWKVRHATNGVAPAGVVDDNGDGKVEVNTLAEIAIYVNATDGLLRADDGTGNPAAANPVLVKGGHVWYWAGAVVDSFDYHAAGVHTESSHPFSISHNVLPTDTNPALGAGGCGDCHGSMTTTSPYAPGWVFDRLVLVDPFDTSADTGTGDGAVRVTKTLRELLGEAGNPNWPDAP